MSEVRNEQTSDESGANVGPTLPDHGAAETVQATGAVSMEEDASGLVPEHDSAPDATKAAAEAPSEKAAALGSRDIAIMSPTRRESWQREAWKDDKFAAEPEAEQVARKAGLFGKRRVAALAAVIALAAVAGAIGGALATAGLSRVGGDADKSSIQAKVLDEQMLRIESELAALKTSFEHSAKLSVAQISKTSDRLDKIEKAQAEPAAKLAKLSEAVDKLRAAPATVVAAAPAAAAPTQAPAAAPAPAKEITGSIPTPAPKPEVKRMPTVDGWVLRDVVDGGALIEGREGVFEVYAGDPVPGLGRIDAVRKQDGRWVVVTSRGLIVAR
ncbi:MAG: hypothetical protein HXX15_01715 [Rhodopseudomonas sp.]|uniref:hypothetical protein n=1 Tax=Rhodopseudomonas sp. TaxID=1078 RepID=UPI0018299DA9|nr:hypothetical protein [Rhodopseudomonas sp.]NVN84780.1 hypothetical protein [Rhodopseudomonas sp.]